MINNVEFTSFIQRKTSYVRNCIHEYDMTCTSGKCNHKLFDKVDVTVVAESQVSVLRNNYG